MPDYEKTVAGLLSELLASELLPSELLRHASKYFWDHPSPCLVNETFGAPGVGIKGLA
jgi:hypothetical protein